MKKHGLRNGLKGSGSAGKTTSDLAMMYMERFYDETLINVMACVIPEYYEKLQDPHRNQDDEEEEENDGGSEASDSDYSSSDEEEQQVVVSSEGSVLSVLALLLLFGTAGLAALYGSWW